MRAASLVIAPSPASILVIIPLVVVAVVVGGVLAGALVVEAVGVEGEEGGREGESFAGVVIDC